MKTDLEFARSLRIAGRHETEFGNGRAARVRLELGKTTQGGNGEESFLRIAPQQSCFWPRPFRALKILRTGKRLRGKVRQLPRRERGRQAGNEVVLDQGKSAEEITKTFSTSTKHASAKSLTPL
jgi:hypothetical protein